MNIFKAMADVSKVIEQGRAIKFSTVLTNAEAGGAMLYGLISSAIFLLRDLGVDIPIGTTDIHTMVNGWTITASFVYGIYRIATNPAAGIKSL